MAKYNLVEGASLLHNEMMKNNLIPDVSTYNQLILFVNTFNETSDNKAEMIIERLKEMKNFGIKPNLSTFNNCLHVISKSGAFQKSIPLALDILKEMEILNISKTILIKMFSLNVNKLK